MRTLSRQTRSLEQNFSNSAGLLARHQKKPSRRITLRLTDEEDAKLRQMSEGTTVSAFIRQQVFDEKKTRRPRRSYMPVQDKEAMAKALGLLGQSRIANNLNQLAYHANTGTLLIDEETIAKLNEAYDHVRLIRAELIKGLGLSGKGAA